MVPPGTVYTRRVRVKPFIRLHRTELDSMGPGQMGLGHLGPSEWGTWRKWAPRQMGIWEMMSTMANGHFGIWRIWSKRTLGANV